MKTLIWSVAWGEYRYMLQSLMSSIRSVGIEHDILTFSDQPLSQVISCEMDKSIHLDGTQYWKFEYLNKVAQLDYDVLVFIDSDHYFVRKPRLDFHEMLAGDPWHSFLESPLNSPITSRSEWWQVKNEYMVKMWRDFGVHQKTVYNTNGGFWICKREFARQAKDTVYLFRDMQSKKGLNLPEEVPIAVLSHMFSMDYNRRLHKNLYDMWASEWTGALKDRLPDGNQWEFNEYMTGNKFMVNPSIVHAMRSKNALVQNGRQIFEKTKDERKFMTWEEIKSMVNSNVAMRSNVPAGSLVDEKKKPSSSSSKDCGCGRKKKSSNRFQNQEVSAVNADVVVGDSLQSMHESIPAEGVVIDPMVSPAVTEKKMANNVV